MWKQLWNWVIMARGWKNFEMHARKSQYYNEGTLKEILVKVE